MDVDGDGTISKEEFVRCFTEWQHMEAQGTVATFDTSAESGYLHSLSVFLGISEEMSTQERQEASDVFHALDGDGSGVIDLNELKRATWFMGLSQNVADALMLDIDRDQDGYITEAEFTLGYTKWKATRDAAPKPNTLPPLQRMSSSSQMRMSSMHDEWSPNMQSGPQRSTRMSSMQDEWSTNMQSGVQQPMGRGPRESWQQQGISTTNYRKTLPPVELGRGQVAVSQRQRITTTGNLDRRMPVQVEWSPQMQSNAGRGLDQVWR